MVVLASNSSWEFENRLLQGACMKMTLGPLTLPLLILGETLFVVRELG